MSNLRVRRLADQDLPLRVEWFNNPSVYRQMAVDVPFSLASTRTWFSKAASNPARYDVAFVDERDVVVAMGGLTDIDRRNGRAELYIVAEPDKTGQGVGTRAVRWLCDYGFGFHNMNRIYLYTMLDNDGARRLYERLGFQAEGVMRQHVLHHGAFVNRYVHGLLREEWEATSWARRGDLRLSDL